MPGERARDHFLQTSLIRYLCQIISGGLVAYPRAIVGGYEIPWGGRVMPRRVIRLRSVFG